MSLRWNNRWKAGILPGVLIVLLSFIAVDTFFPVRQDVSYSRIILDDKGNFVHAYLSDDDKWRLYTELDEITDDWIKAIIVKEDRFFSFHPGFNPISIIRAAFNNGVKGYRTSGASTITMQTIRLLEPRPRNVVSKLTEIFRAMQLEWHYSKKEILQLYVNLLPYGGNIEGIKSASLIYLNKFPQQLSLDEIAVLAIIPNNPEKFKFGGNETAIMARRNALLHYFNQRNTFHPDVVNEAMNTSLHGKRRQLPRKAPHFSRMMRYKPGPVNLHTTLDLQVQSKAEELVSSYHKQLGYLGIHNISVLIIDNRNSSVKAWVGSQDFNDNEYSGQVDGITALRSPGSTLKPFIYGLAFDKGQATPKTVLTDLPVNYNGYQPENYDETYRGNVTMEYALAHSLNVPAVKTLDRIGVETLTATLARTGFNWIEKQQNDLGLSLALGGCGVSLFELTNMYSMLAKKGVWMPLRLSHLDADSPPDSILSAGSAYMLHQILSNIERPDLPNESRNAKNLPQVAWKTGTSYGRRDAWSIGYNDQYTIGVWAGNFTGDGVPELSGAEVATPLLLRLFKALESDGSDHGYRKPKTLQLRYVCSKSGKIPQPFCEQEVLDHYLPGISSMEPCNHLTEVWTDEEVRFAYCSYCLGDHEVIMQRFPNLPGDLISYFETENIPYKRIPTHNPKCDHYFQGTPPVIVHPTDGAVYYLDTTQNDGILLKASAGNDVELIHWHLDDNYYGSSYKDEARFTQLPVGRTTISCTDDKGRSSEVDVIIKHF
ncbi:MAG: penicillin-binding protein 1C [Bacteroidetes bacterium]|nr:penicillin-binding protein 1C [Bacteroidota bacterium]